MLWHKTVFDLFRFETVFDILRRKGLGPEAAFTLIPDYK
jgi:hypothetical protein